MRGVVLTSSPMSEKICSTDAGMEATAKLALPSQPAWLYREAPPQPKL